MNFLGDNPGATKFGNFINYYNFHSAEERLGLFPINDDIWCKYQDDSTKYLVLDVGCNSGNFTQILYPFLQKHTKKEVHILGIDIDPNLITRAQENNLYPNNVTYACLDMMEDIDSFKGHFKIHDKNKFDAIFCLSITMWIHLNNGDNGLRKFLEKVTELCQLLIIEPQPWKCYLSAVNRLKKANEIFQHFRTLEIRNNVENEIEQILIKFGLQKIFETVPTKWNRKICFYNKKILDYSVKLY